MKKNIPSRQYHAAMTRKPFPSEIQERFIVRLPDGMRDRIAQSAKASGRSMNAEVVARLQASFVEGPASATGGTIHKSPSLQRMLESLPVDLSSQYALHLYNTELKVAQAELEEAYAAYQPFYDALQRHLEDPNAKPGPTARAKEAVNAAVRRAEELKNQISELAQRISDIHFYRKTQGLPELRSVREVQVSVRVGGKAAAEEAGNVGGYPNLGTPPTGSERGSW